MSTSPKKQTRSQGQPERKETPFEKFLQEAAGIQIEGEDITMEVRVTLPPYVWMWYAEAAMRSGKSYGELISGVLEKCEDSLQVSYRPEEYVVMEDAK